LIAHQGKKLTNFGSLWTDADGVVFENHVVQMGSVAPLNFRLLNAASIYLLEGAQFSTVL